MNDYDQASSLINLGAGLERWVGRQMMNDGT